jgi:hypothetical protein
MELYFRVFEPLDKVSNVKWSDDNQIAVVGKERINIFVCVFYIFLYFFNNYS